METKLKLCLRTELMYTASIWRDADGTLIQVNWLKVIRLFFSKKCLVYGLNHS